MADPLPKNTVELLSQIEHEWKELLAVVEKLTPAQMTSPDAGGWTPKDNLAHLSEWMKVLMGYHMDHRPPHEVLRLAPEVMKNWKFDLMNDWDYDVVNQALFERNRQRSIDEVLDELKQVYAALINKLRATPFEDLMKPRRADDPEQRPLLLWVLGDTTEHFLEHGKTMAKMLG
jgi:hypothetical protein